ncbi:MAG: hypothetical protein ACYTGV_16160 [Planctomycetota bacterium]|jgi:hypothetical protein
MRHPFVFWAALVTTIGACGTSPKKEGTAEPVVISQQAGDPNKPRNPPRPRKPPEWFEEQLAEAERERKEGKIREAIERIYAVREQKPTPELVERFNAILRRLNENVLELDTVRIWVEVVEDPIVFGEPMRVRIHVSNPGPRAVRIPAVSDGSSGSLFVLTLERQEYDINANRVTKKRKVLTPMVGDLEIPPGGTAEQLITIRDEMNKRGLDGFRVYVVGGHLRPTAIEIGGLRRWEAVPIEEASLRSFRPNYEHLADDPGGRIEQAIEKRAGVHLLTASALVPVGEKTAAVDKLVAALRGDRAIDRAIFASLMYLTEVELGRDAAAWRAWWPRVRETYFAPKPLRATAKEPVFSGD